MLLVDAYLEAKFMLSLSKHRLVSRYSVKDFDLLHHAGFDRRFHNVLEPHYNLVFCSTIASE